MSTSEPVDSSDHRTDESASRGPTWTLVAMLGLWVLGVLALYQHRNPVAGAAIVSTLPLLWYDARRGKRTGELGIGRPILVPVMVALFWIVALPIYLLLRVANRMA